MSDTFGRSPSELEAGPVVPRSVVAPASVDSTLLRRIRGLAVGLHGARSLDDLLDQALNVLATATGADRAFIALVDETQTEVRGRRGRGLANETVASVVVPLRRVATEGAGVIYGVVRSGQPALVAGSDPGPNEFATAGFGPFADALTVPLTGADGVLGTMTAAWPSPSDDHAATIDPVMILADHVAAAVDARRRVDAEHRDLMIAEELHAVAQRITAGLSLDDVLASVLRAVEKVLDASSASIFLAGPGGTVGTRRFTTRNTGQPHWDDHVQTRPDGLTATVLRSGEPAVVEDGLRDPRTSGIGKGDNRTFVAMPIRYQDRTLGVLYANWRERRRIASRDLRLVETLATYGAIAVRNARVHEEAVEAARFDGVLLAARTIAHEINNDLALVMGMAEIAQMQARAGQPPDVSILDDVIQGAQRIATHVRQLQSVVRVEERHLRDLPPLLDLGQSTI